MEIRKKILAELVKEYGYSRNQIREDVTFTDTDGIKHQVDLVVYKSPQKKEPRIIVEIKKRLLLPFAVQYSITVSSV